MVVPTLNAEEFQYLDTGILLNGGAVMPFTDINKISGVDAADLRTSTHDREGLDGGYIDAAFEIMRTVSVEGVLYASNVAFETYTDSLKANFAPSKLAQPFYFGTDAGVRAVWGKALGFKYDKESMRRTGKAAFQVQVVCEDPRIYTPTLVTVEIFPSAVALTGRSYPKSYSYGYGGSSGASNALSLILTGNREQPGLIRIYGPATNPQVVNDDTGAIMTFTITIASGDYLEINLGTRTIKLNGTTGRRNSLALTGKWFLFRVGSNNLRLNATAITGGITKLRAQAYQAAWR